MSFGGAGAQLKTWILDSGVPLFIMWQGLSFHGDMFEKTFNESDIV